MHNKKSFKGGKAPSTQKRKLKSKSKPKSKPKQKQRPKLQNVPKASVRIRRPISGIRLGAQAPPKGLLSNGHTSKHSTRSIVSNAVGDVIGNVVHPLAGKAFKAFANIVGNGSYRTNGMKVQDGYSPPMFRRGTDGSVIVEHREYLGDITGSTAFTNTSFQVNPTNTTLFPWLSNLAYNFEQYRVLGMVFEFKSMSADALNSTNTALGTVIMAAEYNALDANFVSKLEMENYEWAVSLKPSESCLYPLEAAPNETPVDLLYIQEGPLPVGADLRLYNWANFQIATVGMQAAADIGELWVSYSLELVKPRVTPGAGPSRQLFLLDTGAPSGTIGNGTGSLFGVNGGRIIGNIAVQSSASVNINQNFAVSTSDPNFAAGSSFLLNTNSVYFPSSCAGRAFSVYLMANNTGVSFTIGGIAPQGGAFTFGSSISTVPGLGLQPSGPVKWYPMNDLSQTQSSSGNFGFSAQINIQVAQNWTTNSFITFGLPAWTGTPTITNNWVIQLQIQEISPDITGSGLQSRKREPLVPIIQRLMEIERQMGIKYNLSTLSYLKGDQKEDLARRLEEEFPGLSISPPDTPDEMTRSLHLSSDEVKGLLQAAMKGR